MAVKSEGREEEGRRKGKESSTFPFVFLYIHDLPSVFFSTSLFITFISTLSYRSHSRVLILKRVLYISGEFLCSLLKPVDIQTLPFI